MKLIFLDIDGVLNSDQWMKSVECTSGEYPQNQFDPKCVELFNKIVFETGARVVLSSTWRLNYTIEQIREIFKSVHVKCEVIDFTPDLKKDNDYVIRGNEILKWCKDNEDIIGCKYLHYTDFAILDDNNDMLLWQQNHFYLTERLCGLSPSNVRTVVRELNRG